MAKATRHPLSGLAGSAANRPLRRVLIGYGAFALAEFAIWISLLLYAYGRDGATGSMVIVLVQLGPSVVLSSFLGAVADRRRPATVLAVSYVVQAVLLAALAFIIGLGGPLAATFPVAACAALALDVVRPAQAALLPGLVRTPEELTTANIVSGWTDGAASLAGPAMAGLVIAFGGVGDAIAVTAGANALAGVLALSARSSSITAAAEHETDGEDERGVLGNVRATLSDPVTRLLLGMNTFYYLLVGSLDLICVVLAVSLLHLGSGAAGYLNGAVGAGATLAGLVTISLAGQSRLARILAAALLTCAAALVVLGFYPSVAAAFGLMALLGLAGTVFSTSARTLLQRAAPPDATAGVFAVLEATTSLGLVSGTVVVRLGIAIGGLRAANLAPAACCLAIVLVAWPRLRQVDAAATIPQVEIRLLRSIPIFAGLSPPVVEGVARRLVRLEVPADTAVVREGDAGDRYFAIADGTLSVTKDGRLLRRLGRGEGFGEIALVHDSPRTATVTTESTCLLYGLDKDPFLLVVTGHPSAHSAAERVMTGYDGLDSAGRIGRTSKAEAPAE